MKKNFTKVLLAAAAMTTIGLSYATNSGLLAFAAEEEAEEPAEMVIDPAFILGEDEYTVNSHSAVVVPGATAIKVNFENGPEVKYATYAIDMLTDEDGITEYVASGALSINTLGYAQLDEPATFVTGKQYQLVVKAWDVAEIWNSQTNSVVAPFKQETFIFNGGTGMGVVGQPSWGVDRFEFPGDMVALGVPVRFPEIVLPFGIAIEDCETTVSATLLYVPSDEEEGTAPVGATPLVEAQLFNTNIVSGVVSTSLFAEMMEVGKHYAIQLEAVTVTDAEGEIVAEIPEGAYYATDFVVTPCSEVVTLGEPEWGIEAGVVTEDQINLGIQVRFPDAVLGEEVNPNEVVLKVSAMLYGVLPQGAEGGIMPLAETEDDENIDPDFTNRLIPLLDEPAEFTGDALGGGVLSAFLFAECEELAVGNEYVIILTDVKALCGEQPVAWMDEESVWMTNFVVAELPEPADMTPELICGDESYALNTHSAVSIEQAEALAVKFQNAPAIRKAYYAIDRVVEDEATVSVAYGELSLNQVGYVEFEKPVVFIAGQQYKLTVKAFDTTDILDENLNLVEPMLQESYLINGAANVGVIGTPVFGIDRAEFPEDMIALGVPVRFPEMILPFGIQAEDCEITVSANLYGVPEDEVAAGDDELDGGYVGVTGPVLLQEVKLHTAQVVGGVVTAYLFPEALEVGNHYAIDLQAVTVIDAEGEIVAELGEDDYFATDFVVTPYVAPIEFGQITWMGIDENNNVDAEEANINGVVATFPFANLGTEDATISIFATLYDVTNQGVSDDEDEVDPGFGVQGPVAVAQQMFVGGMNVESGVYEVALFPEVLEPAHSYVISIETMTAEFDDEVILQWDNAEEELFVQFDVVGDLPAEMTAALLNGNDQVNLNGHATASLEAADAVLVRFSNAPDVKAATYAIDRILDEENSVSMASGELSINTFGYATFAEPLVFVAGQQYKLTVKAWNTTETLDENLNVVEPMLCEEYLFNGASAMGIIGQPEWGLELGEEFPEDMINIGLPVRFPEMILPFGVELEECEVAVSATLVEIPANYGQAADEDEVDPGFGVQAPIVIKDAELQYVSTEGGIVTAYLFPEMMEAGKHYAVVLNAVTVLDAEGEIVAELPEDADYEFEFTVAEAADPTAIAGIKAENGKVMFNLFGQKVNNANGVVILNSKKVMVK